MKKNIELQHHLCSGCCMWSGIEDVYIAATGETLPEAFFFTMASSGENTYLKFNNPLKPRMFSTGDGRTQVTYSHLAEAIGLTFRIVGGRSLNYAMKSIKKEIDQGHPVILGPLDMYELPYLKMYKKDHIPMHYVLMTGYDEETQQIYIYDCDREKQQILTFNQLEAAWQITKNVVGDRNGLIRFSLDEKLKSVEEITDYAMKRKAECQLAEKPYLTGISAFHKIACEFPKWEKELSQEAYHNALKFLPEFWGTVPKLPNRLLGVKEPECNVRYHGGCDRFGNCLKLVGNRYHRREWVHAGELFVKCGFLYEDITERIIKYLCEGEKCLGDIPEIFLKIADLQEEAYRGILEAQ